MGKMTEELEKFKTRLEDKDDLIKNKINSDELGTIIHIDIYGTKGFAFKKEYLNSWRADGKTNLHNILDANTIHHLDLVNLYLGKIDKLTYFPSLVSKNGTSFDTGYVILRYENGATLSIFNSIAILYKKSFFTKKDNFLVKSPSSEF